MRSADPVQSVPALLDQFTARQIFLQNSARQLLARDDFALEVQAKRCEFEEQLERDYALKALRYGRPMERTPPDPLNQDVGSEVNEMKIEKIKKIAWAASLSPELIAVEVIRWAHAEFGGASPSPLSGLLRQLRDHLRKRYSAHTENDLAKIGEREVFALITLYVTLVLGWIGDARTALTALALATASTGGGRHLGPDLREHLRSVQKTLNEWAAVMDVVERKLGEPVLPEDWRRVLDPRRPDGILTRLFAERVDHQIAEPDLDVVLGQIKLLRATALAAVDLYRCDQQIFGFAHVPQAFDRLLVDCDLLERFGRDLGRDREDAPIKQPSLSPAASARDKVARQPRQDRSGK